MIVATLDKPRKRSYLIDTDEPFKLLIPGYPEGSNLTILNTAYVGRKKMVKSLRTLYLFYIRTVIQEQRKLILSTSLCLPSTNLSQNTKYLTIIYHSLKKRK